MLITKGDALAPVLEDVVRQRLAANQHTVIDGEGLNPSLAARFANLGVGSTMIVETDEDRLYRTQLGRTEAFRQLDHERQRAVVEMNRLY